MEKNYFEILNAINVSEFVEKKNGLSYLSWSYAWREVKKLYPTANYTVYENAQGYIYHTDGKTCWVKTGVTIEGLEHIEYLPVMDFRNKSIPVNNVTSFDVNKAIQRSLTKAVARHGLGLYIYAGEDLPESETLSKATRDQINAQITEYSKVANKPVGEIVKELKAVVKKDLQSINENEAKTVLTYLQGKIAKRVDVGEVQQND